MDAKIPRRLPGYGSSGQLASTIACGLHARRRKHGGVCPVCSRAIETLGFPAGAHRDFDAEKPSPKRHSGPSHRISGTCGRHSSFRDSVHDALFRLISIPRLRWRLNLTSTKGKPGVGLLREWLDELGPNGRPAESGLETLRYRRIVDSGLPKPVRQHPIGRRRADLAYPEVKLAIEAYGYGSHNGKVKWQKDLDRDNELQRQGWTVIHITWDRLMNDPDGVVELIRSFL